MKPRKIGQPITKPKLVPNRKKSKSNIIAGEIDSNSSNSSEERDIMSEVNLA